MRQDRTAVAQPEDRPGRVVERDDDPSAEVRPPVDQIVIEQLAGITDGQGFSVLGELLNAFLGAVPGRLEALDRAVAAEDLRAVSDQAHALTGSAASFGARGMADLCRELRVAAEGSDLASARTLVRALHTEFVEVRGWLMSFRSRA
jgi:HPt (histidine-containing phosphotransfer) domain-containing protein